MPEDLHSDIHHLRDEMRADRVELYDAINAGFEKILTKFDEHSEIDTRRFEDLGTRMTVVETTGKTVGKILWVFGGAFFGNLFAWAFSYFTQPKG